MTVGGAPADFVSGVLSPTYAGLYQIAVKVPAGLPDGEHAVTAAVGGARSPDGVFLAVAS